jgi:hypothetical protein
VKVSLPWLRTQFCVWTKTRSEPGIYTTGHLGRLQYNLVGYQVAIIPTRVWLKAERDAGMKTWNVIKTGASMLVIFYFVSFSAGC